VLLFGCVDCKFLVDGSADPTGSVGPRCVEHRYKLPVKAKPLCPMDVGALQATHRQREL